VEITGNFVVINEFSPPDGRSYEQRPLLACLRAGGWTGDPRLSQVELSDLLANGVQDGLVYHPNTIRFLQEFGYVWLGPSDRVPGSENGFVFDASTRAAFYPEDHLAIASELDGHWDPVAVDGRQWAGVVRKSVHLAG
jgi:hypothetical protein